MFRGDQRYVYNIYTSVADIVCNIYQSCHSCHIHALKIEWVEMYFRKKSFVYKHFFQEERCQRKVLLYVK